MSNTPSVPTPGGSASYLNPDDPQVEILREAQRYLRPVPMNSLVASAQRITKSTLKDRRGFGKPEAWQDDAWDMYDLVGEQRFLATTLAGRLAQAKFYVGKVQDDPMEPPEPLDEDEHLAAKAFSYFGDSASARAQMVARLGINLFVAGDGWLVGIPRWMLPGSDTPPPEDPSDPHLSLDDLEWRMLSVSEVMKRNEEVVLILGEGADEQVIASPDDLFLIRVWRPHPRRWWQADSPTRSSLGVLRELVGLTMHISAQVDSRLAGAGILVVPASAKRAIAVASGLDPDSDDDPFTEALMEAMMTAIQDRSNASALVPLVVTVPDEATGLFQHITFATPLDTEARNLRDEAIRRLALGQDAPPELLLGVGGMNHWGAWLVREDVVTTHIEPPLSLICDAITTQFLWPVLIEAGMDEDEAKDYVVWYDVSHMVQRPNRLQDANMLHDKGVVGDETLREAAGFGEQDAPERLSEPVRIAVEMAKNNPALIDNMPEIVKAFEAILNPAKAAEQVAEAEEVTETGQEVTEEQTGEEAAEEGPAQSEGEQANPQEPPSLAASAGPLHLGNVMERAMAGDPAAIVLAQKVLEMQASLVLPNEDAEYKAAEAGWVPSHWKVRDADLDGIINEGLPSEMPDPLDLQDFRPATDEERKAMAIPPAWTDVEINHAPGARLLVRAKDAKGRRQARYSAEHTEAQAAKKFARLRALHENIGALDTLGDDDTDRALGLIRKMGLRPGSDANTQAEKQAYGATNLRSEHVVEMPDGSLHLTFTGKKGVDIDLAVTNPDVAEMLRAAAEGKQPGERLFDTNERKVLARLKELVGPEFLVKDLRTYLANEIALSAIAEMDAPKTLAEFRKARKAVAVAVSNSLGNTPSMALSSYINPAVFADWEASLEQDVTDPDKEDIK